MIRIPRLTTFVGALCTSVEPVCAHQNQADRWSNEVSIELNNFTTIDQPGSGTVRHHSYFRAQVQSELRLSNNLALYSSLLLEPVGDSGSKVRIVDRDGLFVEEIGLLLERDNQQFFLGKFNPAFGVAWDKTPNVFLDDIADDYEMTEMVGIATHWNLSAYNRWVPHLSLAWYRADTSALSGSVLTAREQLRVEDGGPANTDDLASVAVALDGDFAELIPGFNYHLGYRRQSSDYDHYVERGLVAAFEYRKTLAKGMEASLLYEWATFDHYDAGPNSRRYHTVAAELAVGDWMYAAAHSRRESGTHSSDRDVIYQWDVGYQFDDATLLNVGWRTQQEGGDRWQEVALRVRWDIVL